jgi:leucyl aminopeptidase (aminopeptidase T)
MVCDEPLIEAGLAVCRAACAAGAAPTLTVLPECSRPLAAASQGVVASIAATDALLLWEGTMHPVETAHRRYLRAAAAASGCRMAFGGYIDEGVLAHEMAADYAELAERTRRFADALAGARTVRVTGAGGTDLTVSVAGRRWVLDDGRLGERGATGNLPAGEVFIAPLEDSAEGVLVVDRSIAAVGAPGLVDEPVRVEFLRGRVASVAGGRAADAFRELIRAPGGDVIAELGIGTNERARMQGNVMTDEKVLGSAHVAVGYNLGSYGGANDSPIHCDGCFADATVEVDGRVLIAGGELTGGAQ